jgi:hypothetical protein
MQVSFHLQCAPNAPFASDFDRIERGAVENCVEEADADAGTMRRENANHVL